MFEALKNLLVELTGEAPKRRVFEAADYRLAAAALLVHIASIDGEFGEAEKARLQAIVQSRFGLEAEEARELILGAWESEREAVDLYRFTSVLKRTLDDDGRRQVVAMLWDMAYADGDIHEFEENVVWRVAELLGVSTRERVEMKREAKPAPGPWSPRKEQE